MRHSATRSILERRDTIIVASVSCIYGIGSVQSYSSMSFKINKGEEFDLKNKNLLSCNIREMIKYILGGLFRNLGDMLEIFPAHLEDKSWRISFLVTQ